MKERSIIFSAQMVRAILEGRKTQTRRLRWLEEINQNPDAWSLQRIDRLDYMAKKSARGKFGAYFSSNQIAPRTLHIAPVVSPYGKPGDRLWVRETWCPLVHGSYEPMERDRKVRSAYDFSPGYAADPVYGFGQVWDEIKPRWRPSIFMPRWASRITLEIADVRVQRVQEISQADVMAEGISKEYESHLRTTAVCRAAFVDLWNSIHGSGAWERNDWVFAYTFRRIACN